MNLVNLQDTKSAYKNELHFYVINELSKKEIKNIIIYYSIKTNKIPGVNLTKEVKDVNTDNYDTLMKEIEEDENKLEAYTIYKDWKN